MSEIISKIILLIEAVTLCLPITIIYFFKIIPATIYTIKENKAEPLLIVVTINLLIIVGIFTSWKMIVGFLCNGGKFLKNFDQKKWWKIAYTMVFLTITAIIYAKSVKSYEPSSLLSFGWGMFFLPSFFHLLIEKIRK